MAGDVMEFLAGWVEKSGRAMELRVARQFLRNGAEVLPSYRYLDPAFPDSLRECDVVAQYSWTHAGTPCLLLVSVEVKSSVEHPWVAFKDFGRDPEPGLIHKWVSYLGGPAASIEDSYNNMVGTAPFTSAEVATHIVSAGSSEKANQIDPAYSALRQVLAASEALHRRYLTLQQEGKGSPGEAGISLIVTAAPLFLCGLSSDGEVEFEQVERLDVLGHNRDGVPKRVFVCSEDALGDFTHSLAVLAHKLRSDDANKARWDLLGGP